jgi:DtxR family transcriptional regulator, Mn-dependent transcriptional regulator
MKLTISKEDYLKAVAEAAEESDQPVSSAILCRRLGVSAPAVTAALRRLSRDGLLRVGPTGALRLTETGREITARLIRRHYLIERMLTEVFGLEWYKVHEEAERLEHAVSDDFERRLIERLGTEAPCPHGHHVESRSPRERRRRGLRLLCELGAGETATIRAVHERDRALLEYMDRVGLRPGALVELESRNVDDTLDLRVGGVPTRVGAPIGGHIWVSCDVADSAHATRLSNHAASRPTSERGARLPTARRR